MWNLWSPAKTFFTLLFEVGASNKKSCMWRPVIVACSNPDCLGQLSLDALLLVKRVYSGYLVDEMDRGYGI